MSRELLSLSRGSKSSLYGGGLNNPPRRKKIVQELRKTQERDLGILNTPNFTSVSPLFLFEGWKSFHSSFTQQHCSQRLSRELGTIVETYKTQKQNPVVTIVICHTHLSITPAEVTLFSNLIKLDLSHQRLESLPLELKSLSKLKIILLNWNFFSIFPKVLSLIPSLRWIEISHNFLTSIPSFLSELSDLRGLDVSWNNLSSLPPSLSDLKFLQIFYVIQNPLISPPPSVIDAGTSSILKYLRFLRESTDLSKKARFLFVGDDDNEKYQLLHILTKKDKRSKKQTVKCKRKTTNSGFSVKDIPLGKIASGSGISDSTKKTLYISSWYLCSEISRTFPRSKNLRGNIHILVCKLSEKNSTILKYLSSIHKDDPIIIVVTEFDLHNTQEAKVMLRTLAESVAEYTNIPGIVGVDCDSTNGLPNLRKFLYDFLLSQDFMKEMVPNSFHELEHYLEKEKKNFSIPIISWEQFTGMAFVCGITVKNDVVSAAHHLFSLGLVWFIEDGGDIVVDVEWLMKGLQIIVDPSKLHHALRQALQDIQEEEYLEQQKLKRKPHQKSSGSFSELEIQEDLLQGSNSLSSSLTILSQSNSSVLPITTTNSASDSIPKGIKGSNSSTMTPSNIGINNTENLPNITLDGSKPQNILIPISLMKKVFKAYYPESFHDFIFKIAESMKILFRLTSKKAKKEKGIQNGAQNLNFEDIPIYIPSLFSQRKYNSNLDPFKELEVFQMLGSVKLRKYDRIFYVKGFNFHLQSSIICSLLQATTPLYIYSNGVCGTTKSYRTMSSTSINSSSSSSTSSSHHIKDVSRASSDDGAEYEVLYCIEFLSSQPNNSSPSSSLSSNTSVPPPHASVSASDYIHVTTQGIDRQAVSNLFITLVELLESEFDTSSSSSFSDSFKVESYVPCPVCRSCQFSISDCLSALSSGLSCIDCHNIVSSTHFVTLDSLVPDLALVSLDSKRIDYDSIKIITSIGSGAFGKIYKGTLNDQIVAVKVLESADSEFRHEVWLMSGLIHPNLVQLYGWSLNPQALILEFCDSNSLYNYIHNTEKKLSKEQIFRFSIDIAKGMSFLHSLNPPIVHRDLKSPNILLNSIKGIENEEAIYIAKVADFGLSSPLYTKTLSRRAVDQPTWLAPEVLEGKDYSEKADVYAYAIVIWEMYYRKFPFDEYSIKFNSDLEEKIIKDNLRPTLDEKCDIPSLVKSMWSKDPRDRPSFIQILESLINTPIVSSLVLDSLPLISRGSSYSGGGLRREGETMFGPSVRQTSSKVLNGSGHQFKINIDTQSIHLVPSTLSNSLNYHFNNFDYYSLNKIYNFDTPDAPSNVQFEGGIIKYGTIFKLIESITLDENPTDQSMLATVSELFISHQQLFNLYKQRFLGPNPNKKNDTTLYQFVSDDQIEVYNKFKPRIQESVISLIATWIQKIDQTLFIQMEPEISSFIFDIFPQGLELQLLIDKRNQSLKSFSKSKSKVLGSGFFSKLKTVSSSSASSLPTTSASSSSNGVPSSSPKDGNSPSQSNHNNLLPNDSYSPPRVPPFSVQIDKESTNENGLHVAELDTLRTQSSNSLLSNSGKSLGSLVNLTTNSFLSSQLNNIFIDTEEEVDDDAIWESLSTQITLIDISYYQKVTSSDLIHYLHFLSIAKPFGFTPKDDFSSLSSQTSPRSETQMNTNYELPESISQYLSWAHRVSDKLATLIIDAPNPLTQSSIIERLISICEQLNKSRNFNSFHIVLSSISYQGISSLSAWGNVSSKAKDMYHNHLKFFFKKLNGLYKKFLEHPSDKPTIPSLGILLQEIQSIHQEESTWIQAPVELGRQDSLKKNQIDRNSSIIGHIPHNFMVNFNKARKLSQIISHYTSYQPSSLDFIQTIKVHPHTLVWLENNTRVLNEKQILSLSRAYSISSSISPPTSTTSYASISSPPSTNSSNSISNNGIISSTSNQLVSSPNSSGIISTKSMPKLSRSQTTTTLQSKSSGLSSSPPSHRKDPPSSIRIPRAVSFLPSSNDTLQQSQISPPLSPNTNQFSFRNHFVTRQNLSDLHIERGEESSLLTQAEWSDLMSSQLTLSYSPGEIIISSQKPPKFFFFILSGIVSVEIYPTSEEGEGTDKSNTEQTESEPSPKKVKRKLLDSLRTGQFFGDSCIFGFRMTAFTIKSMTNTHVCCISLEHLEKTLSNSMDLSSRFFKMLSLNSLHLILRFDLGSLRSRPSSTRALKISKKTSIFSGPRSSFLQSVSVPPATSPSHNRSVPPLSLSSNIFQVKGSSSNPSSPTEKNTIGDSSLDSVSLKITTSAPKSLILTKPPTIFEGEEGETNLGDTITSLPALKKNENKFRQRSSTFLRRMSFSNTPNVKNNNNDVILRKFSLPGEDCLKIYSIETPRTSKLYITNNYICISSRMLGVKSKKTFPVKNINEIIVSQQPRVLLLNVHSSQKQERLRMNFENPQKCSEAKEILENLWTKTKLKDKSQDTKPSPQCDSETLRQSSISHSTSNPSFGSLTSSETLIIPDLASVFQMRESDWDILTNSSAKIISYQSGDVIADGGGGDLSKGIERENSIRNVNRLVSSLNSFHFKLPRMYLVKSGTVEMELLGQHNSGNFKATSNIVLASKLLKERDLLGGEGYLIEGMTSRVRAVALSTVELIVIDCFFAQKLSEAFLELSSRFYYFLSKYSYNLLICACKQFFEKQPIIRNSSNNNSPLFSPRRFLKGSKELSSSVNNKKEVSPSKNGGSKLSNSLPSPDETNEYLSPRREEMNKVINMMISPRKESNITELKHSQRSHSPNFSPQSSSHGKQISPQLEMDTETLLTSSVLHLSHSKFSELIS